MLNKPGITVVMCLFLLTLCVPRPLSAWVTPVYNSTEDVDTCCGQTVTYKTDLQQDMDNTEKDYWESIFTSMYPLAVIETRSSSWEYNCHAYVLGNYGWLSDPSDWEGEHYPCYEEDTNGPIFRWGGTHSADQGPVSIEVMGPCQLWYTSKCGKGPIADHCECNYGFHTNRWEQLENPAD